MDQALIKWTQAIYDYLWDRWGIYAGWCAQFCIVAAFGFSLMAHQADKTQIHWAIVLIYLLGLLVCEIRNSLQKRERYGLFNSIASTDERNFFIRYFMWGVLFGDIVYAALQGAPYSACNTAMLQTYCYVLTVKIRRRDDTRFRQLSYQPSGA